VGGGCGFVACAEEVCEVVAAVACCYGEEGAGVASKRAGSERVGREG